MRALTRNRPAVFMGVLLAGALTFGWGAAPARAADANPCGPVADVEWTEEAAQPCPLSNPLPPNNWVPVYRSPVPSRRGAAPPPPAGWLRGTEGHSFICERKFTSAVYYHPKGWRNLWWAFTISDDNVWGWVPEVFFTGGLDDEADGGLRECPPNYPPPPSGPEPPPLEPEPEPLPPDPCDPDPATAAGTLIASFARARTTVTTRYGRKLRVSGVLEDQNGLPLPGAAVCVGAIDPTAGALRQADSIVTGPQGQFTYELAQGPSRRVWFVHRTAAGAVSTSVVVKVRAPVKLGASRRSLRNGQSVLLRGRLGGGSTARGLLVEMQARRGRTWQTFATTRSNAAGGFSYRYRFTRTLGVQRYDLRARVAPQRGYPYAAGGSRPVRLKVTG